MQTDTIQYSGAYATSGVDNSVRLDNFCDDFKVEVIRLTEDEMEFDMIGIDPALANAFRRILISEVEYILIFLRCHMSAVDFLIVCPKIVIVVLLFAMWILFVVERSSFFRLYAKHLYLFCIFGRIICRYGY